MTLRFWRNLIVVVVLAMLILTLSINYAVSKATEKQLYNDVNNIPKNKIGVLLGTAKFRDRAKKIVNAFYQNRIDATVELYMAGKIDYIIVSGDSSTLYYNEPEIMRRDLVGRGIPADRIFLDNAGYRTLDSILRCRDIFGADHFTIISQRFHNERALFIANHKGIDAVAYNAADGDTLYEILIREKMARVRMVLDLILNKQAKYYGTQIQIK